MLILNVSIIIGEYDMYFKYVAYVFYNSLLSEHFTMWKRINEQLRTTTGEMIMLNIEQSTGEMNGV